MFQAHLELNLHRNETVKTFSHNEVVPQKFNEEEVKKYFKQHIAFLEPEFKSSKFSFGWLDKKTFYCSYFLNHDQEFYLTTN